MHTSLQPLGDCHCWWTRVSPRAHVAKFYVRLQIWVLRFETIKIFRVEIYWNRNVVDLLHGIPIGFSFFWYFYDISFQLFKLLCLAKDHWWGFSTRNAHMVHIVNEIRFKMVYTFWSLVIFQPFHSLGECHCWLTRESLRAHAANFYGRLHVIRSVSRASTFSVLKFIEIVICGVYSPSLFASVCFWHFYDISFKLFRYFVWLRITDDGSVFEMRIWSIL